MSFKLQPISATEAGDLLAFLANVRSFLQSKKWKDPEIEETLVKLDGNVGKLVYLLNHRLKSKQSADSTPTTSGNRSTSIEITKNNATTNSSEKQTVGKDPEVAHQIEDGISVLLPQNMKFGSPKIKQRKQGEATGGEVAGKDEVRRKSIRQSAVQATPSTGSGDSLKRSRGQCSKPSLQIDTKPKRGKIEATPKKASPEVQKLVAAIHSIEAIEQFRCLVYSRRDPSPTYRILANDRYQRIEQHIRKITACQSWSKLEKFLTRETQVFLAQDIEDSKDGRIRADPKEITKILSKTGWKKSTLEYHRKRGSQWKRLCGPYNGLLCFVFLESHKCFDTSPDSFLKLKDTDLEMFHQALDNDYIKSICSAGKAFQRSLNSSMEDVEFRWEGRDFHPDKISEEKLLELLQPFPSPVENAYQASAYPNWPRPTGWPIDWTWPADPTSVPNTEAQCDFCCETSCQCLYDCPMIKPRIKDYGKKGRGLQAVAGVAGTTAFAEGERIGYLTGELVPVDTFDDGWALELVREDLNDEPVCQVHCADIGGCLRLLNHSCKPSASFVFKKVSGKYRVVVVAVRCIYDGEEITVSYGKTYMADKECLCGTHHSV